jgi:hypothetical protein
MSYSQKSIWNETKKEEDDWNETKKEEDDWNETKKEEDDELNFASGTFPDEPWLWCGPCKFGVCEEH